MFSNVMLNFWEPAMALPGSLACSLAGRESTQAKIYNDPLIAE